MRPLRIAFLDSWHQAAVDGSGTAVAIGGLARTLQARGHTIERLAPTGRWPRALTARRLWFNWTLPRRLARSRYDLVVGFDFDGLRWAGRSSTPYVCSIKGVLAEEASHERGPIRWLLWSLSRLERLNARRAQRVLTTSAYCAAAIERHYGVPAATIRLVPEGIDLALWPPTSEAARDPATVLCVARQYPRKHVADLLHAWPAVLSIVPEARLVIVGDGPEHDTLQQLAAALDLRTSVRLLGGLPDDAAVRAWYARSTLFCLPSVQEGFGIVFLEALASGLPVVSTTAAAVPEVVPDGLAGTLVPPGAVPALARALTTLLQDADLRMRYAAAARPCVQRFSWDAVADQFLAAIADLV